ncbi:MAG: GMP synthase [Rhodospirillaceae bacterium]|nr:GMP synthase [Rhodospirillaceae bacterium]
MHIALLQHAAFEHAGILRDFMYEDRISFDIVALDEGDPLPDLDPYDALIVLGGPMGPLDYDDHPWLINETALIREAVVERALPTLGICLGHQLLALALGGSLSEMKKTEAGVTEIAFNEAGKRDPLFQGLASKAPSFQWHEWQVEEPPPGAVPLASSALCPVQAIRAAPRAWGVQFHIEASNGTLDEWLTPVGHEDELQTILGPNARTTLSDQAAIHMPRLNADARRMFNNFIQLAQMPAKAIEN